MAKQSKKDQKSRAEMFAVRIKANYTVMRVELADKLVQALRKRDVNYPTIFCLSDPKEEKHLEAIADLIAGYFRENGF